MAVDINCYIELLTSRGWEFAGDIGPNPERDYDHEAPEKAPIPVFHSVNKELAAILVDTGRPIRSTEPFQSIVPRRELPMDLSRVLREHFKYYSYDDGLVYSWFTTDELIAFNLQSKTMIRQAYVDTEVAYLFADCPTDFPALLWPKGKQIRIAEWSREGTQVRWRESYASIVREFTDVFPEALLKVGSGKQTRLIVQAGW